MSAYTPHDHAERVQGCFRCDLSAEEVRERYERTIDEVAAAGGMTREAAAEALDRLVDAIAATETEATR